MNLKAQIIKQFGQVDLNGIEDLIIEYEETNAKNFVEGSWLYRAACPRFESHLSCVREPQFCVTATYICLLYTVYMRIGVNKIKGGIMMPKYREILRLVAYNSVSVP